jgi:hypothetical protein
MSAQFRSNAQTEQADTRTIGKLSKALSLGKTDSITDDNLLKICSAQLRSNIRNSTLLTVGLIVVLIAARSFAPDPKMLDQTMAFVLFCPLYAYFERKKLKEELKKQRPSVYTRLS